MVVTCHFSSWSYGWTEGGREEVKREWSKKQKESRGKRDKWEEMRRKPLRAGERGREIKERELKRGLETERHREEKGTGEEKVRGRRVKSGESETEKDRNMDDLKRVGESYSLQRNLEKEGGSWAEA